MILDDKEALERLRKYAERRGMQILEQQQLGHGSDGAVWKTSEPSAVKAFYIEKTYKTELECYRQLKRHSVQSINGFNVPLLEGFDNELLVIEMTIVVAPFILDFGKAHIGRLPPYYDDRQKMLQAQAQWRDLFGSDWDRVSGALHALRAKFDIHYVDPRPGNINCGPSSIDDDDWDKEPGIDYSEYE